MKPLVAVLFAVGVAVCLGTGNYTAALYAICCLILLAMVRLP